MKKKILALTLCFSILFSSINYKKSYADGGVVSVPILATVSALAIGTGIALNNLDDVYDIGRMFYDYVDGHNELTWATVQAAFLSSTTMFDNKVKVGSTFLDIVKGFFDTKFSAPSYYGGEVPKISDPYDKTQYLDITQNVVSNGKFYLGFSVVATATGEHCPVYATYINDTFRLAYVYNSTERSLYQNWVGSPDFLGIGINSVGSDKKVSFYVYARRSFTSINAGVVAFPYEFDYPGGYTWDDVKDRVDKETGDLSLPIPGNLDKLVGQTKGEFWENTDGLSKDGSFDISDVSNPSISIDKSQTITGSNTGVGEGVKPSLPSLPSWGSGLDFSPITSGVFTDKFPFCLAKDVSDIISVFNVDPKAPVFKIPLVSEEITIDLTEFELWFDIMRFFILVGFIVSLIVLTRGIIG